MTNRSDLNGIAKRVFGDISRAIPSWATMQEKMPFKQRAKIGSEYEELVILRRPQGITANRTGAGNIYTLNDARPPKSEPARVSGTEIIMRDQFSYGLAAAAQRSGPQAYEGAVAEILASLAEQHRYFVEVMMLYGQSTDGIGRIASVSGASTTRDWVITPAQWAPGLWVQAENAEIDVFNNHSGTQRNTNATIVVTAVNTDTRTVSVSGNATDLTAVVAGDMIVFRNQDTQSFYGADAIIQNTGTLFNISATTYSLWRGNTRNNSAAPLTLAGLHSGVTQAAVKGGLGDMLALVNTYAWQDLIDDQGALRRFAGETKKEYVQGAQAISFYGSNGGKLEIMPHPMVKCGDAFGFCVEDWIRGGESDLANGLPGATGQDENFFHEIPNQSGAEVRNFSSQFLLCKKPARQMKIGNILPRSFA